MSAVMRDIFLERGLADRDVVPVPSQREAPKSYTLSALPPNWFYEIVRQIAYMRSTLRENWDSHGASPISPQAADLAVRILDLVVSRDTPKPSIVPTPEGHLQAEWHVGGYELEVEFASDTCIKVLFEDLQNPDRDWEDVLDTDLGRLSSALAKLSR